jgi:hypothetical protein
MRVFELGRDVDHYRWLATVHENDIQALPSAGDRGVGASWKPIEVEFIDDDLNARLPEGDFPTLGITPTVSQRAVDVLLDLLVENGELLPLLSKEGSYYAYHVTRVVDAFDEAESELKRFSDGAIMRVTRYAFRPERLAGMSIFRVPQLSQVFVTEIFVERVIKAKLTGFEFVEVWKGPGATATVR